MNGFMKRWKLSLKLPSPLEKARKIASSDPEIIYGFYKLVEEQISKLGIQDRPECIWNVDETSLFIDAQRFAWLPQKVKKQAEPQLLAEERQSQ